MGELFVFSAEQASHLSGLSLRQLRHWDQQGFFVPQYAAEDRSRPFSRVYSFRDIVGLRTLAVLRIKYGVSLQELKKVSSWFSDLQEVPWSTLTFYVRGRRVFFQDPKDNVRRAGALPAQTVMPIEMEKIANEVRDAVARLCERKPDDVGKVVRNRYVLHNAYVIAGTRIPTSAIWNFHQAGYSVNAIIKQYPRLNPQDVQAAIDHEREQNRKRQGKRAS